MKYTGTATPAARNAATPHAVACWLPCLDACANTPAEIAAARATAIRKVTGSAVATTERYVRGTGRAQRSGAGLEPTEPSDAGRPYAAARDQSSKTHSTSPSGSQTCARYGLATIVRTMREVAYSADERRKSRSLDDLQPVWRRTRRRGGEDR